MDCGDFSDNIHVLWNCSRGSADMGESLKHSATNLRFATLEEWLADSSPDMAKTLLHLLKLLSLPEECVSFFNCEAFLSELQ